MAVPTAGHSAFSLPTPVCKSAFVTIADGPKKSANEQFDTVLLYEMLPSLKISWKYPFISKKTWNRLNFFIAVANGGHSPVTRTTRSSLPYSLQLISPVPGLYLEVFRFQVHLNLFILKWMNLGCSVLPFHSFGWVVCCKGEDLWSWCLPSDVSRKGPLPPVWMQDTEAKYWNETSTRMRHVLSVLFIDKYEPKLT